MTTHPPADRNQAPARFLVYAVLEALPEKPSLEYHLDRLGFGQLQTLCCQGLVVLFQKVAASRLTNLEKKDLSAWVAEFQRVNIDVFRHWNMVPLRFGFFVDGEAELRNWLAFSYLPLAAMLARVKGRAEFVVHLHWDFPQALADIRREISLEGIIDRAEAGRLLFEAAEKKRREVVAVVHEHLARRAVESVEMKIIDEEMLMNRSYLVERSEESAFDAAMAEVGQMCKACFRFKYLGPLPPNSFVPLEFKRGSFGMVDWARRLLGLPEMATLAEVKHAFRRAALASHPDRKPGTGDPRGEFQQISAAYRIIKDYCHSVRMREAQNDTGVSFLRPDVEQAFVVGANP